MPRSSPYHRRPARLGGALLALLGLLLGAFVPAAAAPRPQPAPPQLGWSDDFSANGKLNVLTTVAPLSSLVRNVGGDRINLHGLIPSGVDSHTFEPTPGDAKIIAGADLVLLNGLHLETPTERLVQANLKPGAAVRLLGENTISEADWIYDFSFPKEEGDPNPHLWMNPIYALRYAELARDWLSERDPAGRDAYAANFDRYAERLRALDRGIETAVNTIPPENRRLLTYHDSWAYFARRYGMTVIGAAQPSDFKEPSPREVAALIDQIRREHVPAVFGSEVFPSKVLEQIAAETGATYYDNLRDDEPPGEPNEPRHGYLGLMLDDMQTMIPALGGNVDALRDFDPADTWLRAS